MPSPTEDLDEIETWISRVEHHHPVSDREILLLGIEARVWRRAAQGDKRAEGLLCHVVASRAQQCLIRGDLGGIEPLTRRALELARSSGDTTAATGAVSTVEWLRQRVPGGAMAAGLRLGAWAERVDSPRHRYWLRTAQALAFARAGELAQAVETLDRLDQEGGEGLVEAAFHLSDRAEAYLLGGEPIRALEQIEAIGEVASPVVEAKIHLALGQEPPESILSRARALAPQHWLYRCELERIERGLNEVRQGRRVRPR